MKRVTVAASEPRHFDRFYRYLPSRKAEAALWPGSTELWVFVENGKITPGMQKVIDLAMLQKKPVRWFAVTGDEIIELAHLPIDVMPQKSDLMAPQQYADATTSAFERLQKRLEDGEDYEGLEGDLDDVLGTGLDVRDKDVEEAWERAYRGDDE